MTLLALALLPLLLLATSTCRAAAPRVLVDDVHFAEGPVWHGDRLYFVEYDRNTVTTWNTGGSAIFATLPGCGPSAVLAMADGSFLVTCYDSGSIGRLAADGSALPAWDHDREGQGFVGPNDFAPDGHGGVYFTASGHPGQAADGAAYYIAADGTISRVAGELNAANGIAVSPDGHTLYVIETEANHLLAFTIDAPGQLSNRHTFVDVDALAGHVGHIWPDGVKIDGHGRLYIGQNPRDPHAPQAGTIFVVDARGMLLRRLALPSPGVPNFTFSPDGRTLYVTALDQIDKSPYRGKLYSLSLR